MPLALLGAFPAPGGLQTIDPLPKALPVVCTIDEPLTAPDALNKYGCGGDGEGGGGGDGEGGGGGEGEGGGGGEGEGGSGGGGEGGGGEGGGGEGGGMGGGEGGGGEGGGEGGIFGACGVHPGGAAGGGEGGGGEGEGGGGEGGGIGESDGGGGGESLQTAASSSARWLVSAARSFARSALDGSVAMLRSVDELTLPKPHANTVTPSPLTRAAAATAPES